MPDWSTNDSKQTYNIQRWSGGYFDISSSGHLVAVNTGSQQEIDLYQVAEIARQSSLPLPILLRFPYILHDRVDALCRAFDNALSNVKQAARYTPVYPIKVNQNRNVVTELLAARSGRLGLEAGSKPELLTVLALSGDKSTVICNGYKDREYIRLALAGSQVGLDVYIVIEKLSELDILISEINKSGIKPGIGIRLKLASIASGKWQNSGGERSKFGLTSSQVLAAIEKLSAADLLDNLVLLHVHLGSQISNIQDIQNGLDETTQFFVQLSRMGINIRAIDVGGGLAVDYDGTGTGSDCSMNYELDEYANAIVEAFDSACRQNRLPMPHLISESGRALTAHHAVLVCDVTEIERHDENTTGSHGDSSNNYLATLARQLENLQQGAAVIETYHNTVHAMQEIQQAFNQGLVELADRARAEQLYYAICLRLRDKINPAKRPHQQILEELDEILADKVFCNFSIFQSIPDVWAIDQIFPIVPLQRLSEKPDRRAILHDLTCDSDGRVDLYVDEVGIESTLPLHHIEAGERYLLGIFLVGAYQETLGDIHNLFGDTAAVNVSQDDEGNIELDNIFSGENVSELLVQVDYDPEDIRQRIMARAMAAGLPEDERKTLVADLESSLRSYSYLVMEEIL